MRHLKAGRKLKRTASHRAALLRNLAMSLLRSEQKAIRTTVAKAKELRPFVERLITRARRAYALQRSGAPAAQILHYRRLVGRFLRDEAVVQELFDVVAPIVAERNGGYTRIVKLGFRRGDGAQEAIIQLVDWGAPQDGARTLSRKRRQQPKQKQAPASTPVEQSQPEESSPALAQSDQETTPSDADQPEQAVQSNTATSDTETASSTDNISSTSPDNQS